MPIQTTTDSIRIQLAEQTNLKKEKKKNISYTEAEVDFFSFIIVRIFSAGINVCFWETDHLPLP